MSGSGPAGTALAFADLAALDAWLAANHGTERELWVRIFKKGSGVPSVTWADCVQAGLVWGWIDGRKNALDAESFLQRLTPRRPGSTWSLRNRDLAESLMAAGEMQPPGLARVAEAQANGRWQSAYAGSADMEIPADFLRALAAHPAAAARFADLRRAELFSIYHQVQTAKTEAARTRRIAAWIAALSMDPA